jgi:hypothetical protein
MSISEFKITKKNKYVWKAGNVKLVFSESSIQPHDTYMIMKDTNDILYFYYTVELFEKVLVLGESKYQYKKSWKLVASNSVFDFPNLLYLQEIINNILDDDCTDGGQKMGYPNGMVGFMKNYFTDGCLFDDYYRIEKIIIGAEKPRYSFYAGVPVNTNDSHGSKGIYAMVLDEGDILNLKNCVDEFIQHAIDTENGRTRELIHFECNNKEVIEKKLFEYNADGGIENIYQKGDILWDVTILGEDEDKPAKYLHNVTIEEINNGPEPYARGTVKFSGNDEAVQTCDITHIFREFDSRVNYSLKEITEDFLNLIRGTYIEKDFEKNPINWLFDTYKDAIINRTAMFREEHKILSPDEVSVECGVNHNVRIVIKNIVDRLLREKNKT